MRNKRIKVLVIIMLMAISIMGCDNAKDYSGEYNFETDDRVFICNKYSIMEEISVRW